MSGRRVKLPERLPNVWIQVIPEHRMPSFDKRLGFNVKHKRSPVHRVEYAPAKQIQADLQQAQHFADYWRDQAWQLRKQVRRLRGKK